MGRKYISLPHAQTAIYDSEVKLFLKQGISSQQLGRDWTHCSILRDNSATDVIINFFMENIPQANQTCGLETSTGQSKNSVAAGHRTTANFEHWVYLSVFVCLQDKHKSATDNFLMALDILQR